MSTSAPVLGRANLTACLRCRQKKRKCDHSLPKCRQCRLAGVECVSYDAVARRPVPRSYVQSLEDRVASLELKLKHHGLSIDDLETTTEPSRGPASSLVSHHPRSPENETEAPLAHHQQWSASSDLSSGRDQNYTGPAGPEAKAIEYAQLAQTTSIVSGPHDLIWSRVFLEKILACDIRPSLLIHSQDNRGSDTAPAGDLMGDLDDLTGSTISVPNIEAAQNLVRAYLRMSRASLPLLHEVWFQHKLEYLYSLPGTIDFTTTHSSRTSKMTVFFVFGVFAVAILFLQKENPSTIPTWLADRYHKISIRGLIEAGLSEDLEGVQGLLLLSQYSYHHPTTGSVWQLVGVALRLSVELKLHVDPPPTSSLDPLVVDMRRRAFWVAYAMDRNLAMARELPLNLSDEVITVSFPSEAYDEFITQDGIISFVDQPRSPSKLVAFHLLRYRQIQSAIHTVIEQNPSYYSRPVDYSQWQVEMRGRIEQWYNTSPSGDSLNKREKDMVSKFIVNYHNAILRLYRPSINIPSPSEEQLGVMVHSAAKIIELYRENFRHHRLTIYWQSMGNLYSAGVCLMFGYSRCPTIRLTMSRRSLESLAHTCSSMLWGMVERFPAFHNKRDAFDKIVAATFADLDANMDMSASLMQHLRDDDMYFANPLSIPHQQLQNPQDSGALASPIQLDGLEHASSARQGQVTIEQDANLLDLDNFDLSSVDWNLFTMDDITFPFA